MSAYDAIEVMAARIAALEAEVAALRAAVVTASDALDDVSTMVFDHEDWLQVVAVRDALHAAKEKP